MCGCSSWFDDSTPLLKVVALAQIRVQLRPHHALHDLGDILFNLNANDEFISLEI